MHTMSHGERPDASRSAASAGPACDHPDCREPGAYRAPKARDRLDEHYRFCLEHVRAYNRAWNYCAGMGEAEIEAQIRAATCWERPTWRLGQWHTTSRMRLDAAAARFGEAFGLFGQEGARADGRSHREQSRPAAQRRALAVLELKPPVTSAEIKARYKRLVKRFHPDANGGDKAAEERLKLINQAYAALKNRGQS